MSQYTVELAPKIEEFLSTLAVSRGISGQR